MIEALAFTVFWFGVSLLLLNYRNYPGRSRAERTSAVLASVVVFTVSLTYLMNTISKIPAPINSVNVSLWKIQLIMAFVVLCVVALHWFTARFGIPPEMERIALFGTLFTLAVTSFLDYRGAIRWLATGGTFWMLVFFGVGFIFIAISYLAIKVTSGVQTPTTAGRVVNFSSKVLGASGMILMSWALYSYIFVGSPT